MTRRAWTLAGAAIRTYQGKASVSEEQVEDVDIARHLTNIAKRVS